jgi:ribosome-associated translation inhibitor RaiA
MKINIKATNIELTSAINDYVNKKLIGLEKFTKDKEVIRALRRELDELKFK